MNHEQKGLILNNYTFFNMELYLLSYISKFLLYFWSFIQRSWLSTVTSMVSYTHLPLVTIYL